MKPIRLVTVSIAFAVVGLTLAACGPAATASPTPEPPMATASPVPPSATRIPPTATAAPPTATAGPPVVTLFRGDAGRTGRIESVVPRTLPTVVWQKTGLGLGVLGAPLVADGVLIVPNQIGKLRAFDAATGDELWVVGNGNGRGIVTSPVIVGDTVYAGRDDTLYALALADGAERWHYAAGALIYSAPLVVRDTLYFINQDGGVAALDRLTGAVLWQADVGGFAVHPPVYANGRLYVENGQRIVTLNLATGVEFWHSADSLSYAPLAVDAGRIYVGAAEGSFFALNASTGNLLWGYPTDGSDWSAPAVGDGRVFVGSRNETVYAFDTTTGDLVWSFATEDWAVCDPVLAGDTLIVGEGNHDRREGPRHLYALDAATGAELWRFEADGRLLAAPAVADGTIYILTAVGTLYALK